MKPRRLGLALALLAWSALAFIPQAERVEAAVAERNAAAGRTQALRLELVMRIGEGDPVASGELVTHPTGLARLELRGAKDLVERHLLQGIEHTASRNGRPLERPRSFLPPLYLLQADSAATLRAALAAHGAAVDAIGLAPCGRSDCYVIGDPARVPPPPPGSEGSGGRGPALDPDGTQGGFAQEELRVAGMAPARLWVDVETYELRRVERADGVVVYLGPSASFEQVRFPAWLRIEEPGRRPVHFEIRRATPVNAPAAAFGQSWLFGEGAVSDGRSEDAPDSGSTPSAAPPEAGLARPAP